MPWLLLSVTASTPIVTFTPPFRQFVYFRFANAHIQMRADVLREL